MNFFWACWLGFAFTACQPTEQIPADAVVITNASIIDVLVGSVNANQTVVISGGNIIAIGTANDFVGSGQRTIDASGKYLIPGLWDMHTHIFNNNDPEQGPNEWYFPLMISHGVLGVRDMWVKPESVAQVRAWNQEVAQGTLAAPYIAEFGSIVDGPGSVLEADSVSSAEEARKIVQKYKAAGADFVKTYTRLSPEAYEAIHDEAAKQKIAVLGHVPRSVKAPVAAGMRHKSFEHLNGMFVDWSTDEDSLRSRFDYHPYFYAGHVISTYDSTKADRLFDVLSENGSWQVPTLCLWKVATVRGMDEIEDIPIHQKVPEWERSEWGGMEGWLRYRPTQPDLAASYAAMWQLTMDVVEEMHGRGIPFMTGTDIGNPFVYPGFSIHDEMEIFVEAGLTPLEALQTATINPVRYLNAMDSMGSIAPGMLASMLILDANPLEDIRNTRAINTVIQQGRVYDIDDLAVMGR